MVLGQDCFFIFSGRRDEVEIEEGRIEEEMGKTGRYRKETEGCKSRMTRLTQGRVCVDKITVIREEAGRDNYCIYYKNERTGDTRLRDCDSMSIR
jgi:hypothetical protein